MAGPYDEILAWSREQIATMTRDIAEMERGTWRLFDVTTDGRQDITPQWIETLRGRIAELEQLVAAYEKRNG